MKLEIPLTISKVTTHTDLDVYYMDDPTAHIVKAFIRGYTTTPIVMWAGAAYDAIGEWTAADAEARINELNNSGAISEILHR